MQRSVNTGKEQWDSSGTLVLTGDSRNVCKRFPPFFSTLCTQANWPIDKGVNERVHWRAMLGDNGQNNEVTFLVKTELCWPSAWERERESRRQFASAAICGRLLNLCLVPSSSCRLGRTRSTCLFCTRLSTNSFEFTACSRMDTNESKTQKNSRRASNLRMLHAAGHALIFSLFHSSFLHSFSHFCSRLSVCAEAQVIIHWWLLSTDKRPPIMTALFTCFHYGSNAKVSLCAKLSFLFHLVVMISPTLHIF